MQILNRLRYTFIIIAIILSPWCYGSAANAQGGFLPKVDVFFLVDTSSSFSDDLPNFRLAAPGIIAALSSGAIDVNFGLGRFEDYPIPEFGAASYDDKAYQRVLPISPGTAQILSQINSLYTKFGWDWPQSQLPALFQAATGAGQDLSSRGYPNATIPPNQQANFRPGAFPIIVLWTDAYFHEPGDYGSIPYPGPSLEEVLNALNSRGIKVIGMGAGGGALYDLTRIAQGTATLAPAGGVDCDGNGTIDILEGNPLVCPVSSNGVGIGQAIIHAVKGASTTAQIRGNLLGMSSTNPSGFSHEPVNTATGNYVFSRTDLVMPGKGIPFIFKRAYNSQDSINGPLGVGWTHTYHILLMENPDGSVVMKWGDGHLDFFDRLPDGGYSPTFGWNFDTLRKEADGTFRLTKKDQTVYTFSSTRKLLSLQDRNSNSIILGYDALSNLVVITDTVGRKITLTYDASNRITQVTDPLGRIVTYNYDSEANLSSVTNAGGGVASFTYDGNHWVREIKDERGNRLVSNTYDDAGRVVTQTNGRGFTTTFAYGMPHTGDTTITDPRGNQIVHTHDAQLRLIAITDANGGKVNYTYDARRNRTSITDQNGRTALFSYDERGNLISITNPVGNIISFAYDSRNNLISEANARGFSTTFGYDPNGNLIQVRDALGNQTLFAYNSLGQPIQRTDARGKLTKYAYDTQGNLTRITDAMGGETSLVYDQIGRPLALTNPNGNTASISYDVTDRLTAMVNPLGHETRFTYDAVSNLTEILDAKGNRTQYGYDEVNKLAAVRDALGYITRYTYDTNNNRIVLTNANSDQTTHLFDGLNRPITITDPSGSRNTYTYDPVGNVVAMKDANGTLKNLDYDANNRLIGISYGDGSSVTYTYDANGNRLSMVDSRGETSYVYDALDRLVEVVHPNGAVKYGYDELGSRTSLTYPDGKVVTYDYDSLNRLIQVRDWNGQMTTYHYDAASKLVKVHYPNQTSISYRYDAANRLEQMEHRRGMHLLGRFTYKMDKLGNRTELEQTGIAVRPPTKFTFTYDALSQLLAVEEWQLEHSHHAHHRTEYTYDPVGNRLSLKEFRSGGAKRWAPTETITYTYDAADRLLQAGDTTFTYDPNGSRLTTSSARGRVMESYAYDAAKRLIRVVLGGNELAYTYDGDGNKVGQSIHHGSSTRTFEFLNDVAVPLPVLLQEEGVEHTINYLYGLGLIAEESTETMHKKSHDRTFFYHPDGLGSTRFLTNHHGQLESTYDYDVWGESLDNFGQTRERFLFTHEEQDLFTGLYYLRARWYDPAVGRFLTRDAFPGFTDKPLSLNKYLYSFNNPPNYIDPSGDYALGDDVVALLAGAAEGLASQYASDVIQNYKEGRTGFSMLTPRSDWKEYAVSAIGGAATGEALLYCAAAGPVVAGVCVGEVSALTSLGKDWVMGRDIDWGGVAFDSLVSGLTASIIEIPGEVPGRLPNLFSQSFFTGKHAQRFYENEAASIFMPALYDFLSSGK
jgi:RHS repeat-associated protein